MPRWNAWQCRLGSPGTAMPARRSAPSRGASAATDDDGTVGHDEAHVARPAGGQQRVVEEQLASHV